MLELHVEQLPDRLTSYWVLTFDIAPHFEGFTPPAVGDLIKMPTLGCGVGGWAVKSVEAMNWGRFRVVAEGQTRTEEGL